MLKRIAIVPVIVLLFLSACKKSGLEVSNKNFTEEIQAAQNLVFTFNHDLVADSMVGEWDTTEYIKFVPEVKGKFKWETRNELIFSPLNEFRGSTDFKGEFTKLLVKFSDKKKHYGLPDEEEFSFHTPYLKAESSDIIWARSEKTNAPVVRANIYFNYRVNPADVYKLLKLEMNGKPLKCEGVTTDVSDIISVAIPGVDKNIENPIPLKITLDKGLKSLESDYVTKSVFSFPTFITSPEKLSITQAVGEFDGNQGVIKILTNQELNEQDFRSLITLKPAVTFTAEIKDYGLLLRGNFAAGVNYDLYVSPKLKGFIGGELGTEFYQLVPFGEQSPQISFTTSNGIYLSSKSSKNVGINIVNVRTVKVSIYKIYENNIISYVNQNKNEYYYDESEEVSYNTYNIEQYGSLISERSYETKNLSLQNGVSLLNLNLNDHSMFKGVYLVCVASEYDQWIKSTKLIAISDIGLIVKQTEEEIIVFANSIKSAQPFGNVKVSFISTNNQVLHTATTDASGVAKFLNVKGKAPGFQVGMITTRSEDDFNYMTMNDLKVDKSRFDVGGRYANPSGYQAFIYGDREIYRPGETININTIIRNEQWGTIGDVPVKITLLLPNGSEFKTVRKNLSKQGAAEASIKLPAGSVTGTYTVEVYSANDILLESKSIGVEEFMPDRIKVNLMLSKKEAFVKDPIVANISAFNLFGPPAANRNFEVNFSLRQESFSPEKFADYNFSLTNNNQVSLKDEVFQGKTDENGRGTCSFALSEEYKDMGQLSANFFATVFDETGRPVNKIENVKIYSQPVFFGIKHIEEYVNTNQVLQVPLVALNKDANYVAASARVKVIRYKWQNVIQKSDDNRYRYVSQKKEEILSDKILQYTGGRYLLSFVPRESGEYEIRVDNGTNGSYVSQFFYAYGWGSTQNTSFQVNKEGQVTIQTDKPFYEVGESAKLLFKTPFQGRLLVTIERNKVFEYYTLETDKKSAVLTLPIKDAFLPNMYVSATLIKPLDDGAIPLTVAHGFLSVKVQKKETILPITITAPEKVRSNSTQTIKIKTNASSDIELTVAVVDEGILQLKNTKTPDPHSYFYQKRALEVNSSDVYLNLFPEMKIKSMRVGGDGYNMGNRVNPLANKRVQLISYWSGIIKTNSSGEATYTVKIPQFSGDLRVMAVAWKERSFGSADKHIKVADPIVVSTALPRFLSPGDTVNFPVTLTNTTTTLANGNLNLSLTDNLQVMGKNAYQVAVPANSEKQVNFKLVAKRMVSEGSVSVSYAAFNETFTEKQFITTRPITSLLKSSGHGMVTNATKNLNFDPMNVIKSQLIISKSPIAQFTDNIYQLLGYPHGCLEQTISKAFPQMYFSEFLKNMKGKTSYLTSDPNFNVQEAIRKVESQQLYNGGFGYWPGSDEANYWGSVYAVHFLSEAKKAGFEVNQKSIRNGCDYLQAKLKERIKEPNYWYYDKGNKLVKKEIPAKENFYALYVLAMYDSPDQASMNYYKSNLAMLAIDSKYLLAASYLRIGDEKSYHYILPKNFSGEASVSSMNGSFHSYVRDEAISMNALLDIDPNNPQIGIMAKHISEQMRTKQYWSTQENVFAILGLGKLLKKANQVNIEGEVTINGKLVAKYENKDLVLTQGLSGSNVSITSKGGNLYYFWQMEGLNNEGKYKIEDSYLKIRKSMFNRFGQPITGTTFKQNDLIVIKLSLETTDNSNADNVVITDMLPAGFEIENPRVGGMEELSWIKDNAQPEHMDVRDDRINLFTSTNGNVRNFYYVVRAVSKGWFNMGPVSADAMYNGDYHSYWGGGSVVVR